MTIRGKVTPLSSKVLISHMNFGEQTSAGGIVLHSDDGKVTGIRPRWGKVFAVGPEQTKVKVGEWILLEHGRWSRGHEYEYESGEKITIQLADNNAILAVSDEPLDAASSVDFGAVNLKVPNE